MYTFWDRQREVLYITKSCLAWNASVSGNSRSHTGNGSRGPSGNGCFHSLNGLFSSEIVTLIKLKFSGSAYGLVSTKYTCIYHNNAVLFRIIVSVFSLVGRPPGTGMGVVCVEMAERGGRTATFTLELAWIHFDFSIFIVFSFYVFVQRYILFVELFYLPLCLHRFWAQHATCILQWKKSDWSCETPLAILDGSNGCRLLIL